MKRVCRGQFKFYFGIIQATCMFSPKHHHAYRICEQTPDRTSQHDFCFFVWKKMWLGRPFEGVDPDFPLSFANFYGPRF